jgi:hypothetical protein
MTDGQKESLFMVYVSACNGYMYANDLERDKNLHTTIRQSAAAIANKFKWVKTSLEIKTDSSILKQIDTLRYDEILRLMMNLDEERQEQLEKIISNFVDNINK